jgi:hypothetical protein
MPTSSLPSKCHGLGVAKLGLHFNGRKCYSLCLIKGKAFIAHPLFNTGVNLRHLEEGESDATLVSLWVLSSLSSPLRTCRTSIRRLPNQIWPHGRSLTKQPAAFLVAPLGHWQQPDSFKKITLEIFFVTLREQKHKKD